MVEPAGTASNLKCLVCHNLAREPHGCAACGSLVCEKDVGSFGSSCPQCDGKLEKNAFARNLVNQLIIEQ